MDLKVCLFSAEGAAQLVCLACLSPWAGSQALYKPIWGQRAYISAYRGKGHASNPSTEKVDAGSSEVWDHL